MSRSYGIDLPEGFDWRHWVDRWDRMQERYLVRRAERFATIVRMLPGTGEDALRIVDLGCGPGSLMAMLLDAFPYAEIWGVDFDPTMLLLARERLSGYAQRAHLILGDLRAGEWVGEMPPWASAVVSATALHWLEEEQLAALYAQVAQLLRPGGVFVNADHVGSDDPRIQGTWERNRRTMRAREGPRDAEDWETFWAAYAEALHLGPDEMYGRIADGWEGGVEEGLPLAWHLDRLRQCGFRSVDCFWRIDCDAIYGGVREGVRAELQEGTGKHS